MVPESVWGAGGELTVLLLPPVAETEALSSIYSLHRGLLPSLINTDDCKRSYTTDFGSFIITDEPDRDFASEVITMSANFRQLQ